MSSRPLYIISPISMVAAFCACLLSRSEPTMYTISVSFFFSSFFLSDHFLALAEVPTFILVEGVSLNAPLSTAEREVSLMLSAMVPSPDRSITFKPFSSSVVSLSVVSLSDVVSSPVVSLSVSLSPDGAADEAVSAACELSSAALSLQPAISEAVSISAVMALTILLLFIMTLLLIHSDISCICDVRKP